MADLPPGRAATGVPGLDEALLGGVPRDTLVLLQGAPGSGKTTIGLQFLMEGVRAGETSLLVSNAETSEQLAAIAAAHGWSLDGIHLLDWRESGDGKPEDAEYTLFPEAEVEAGETLTQLFAEVERLRPARLVIDTIAGLRVLAPTPAFYRKQIKRIRDLLAARRCTTLLVDDAVGSDVDTRAHTLAHGLLRLEHAAFTFGADRRRLWVQKLRGSRYLEGSHDFTIETGGVVVYPRLVATDHDEVPGAAPAESGLPALDALAGGGLPRGTSTLLLGPAGSGKSTLASLYLYAAAQRGERSSVYLFDESTATFRARSRGLGISFDAFLESGGVTLNHLDPAELSLGQIADRVMRQVEQDGVRIVLIDTLNGYLHSAAGDPNVLLHLRELLSYLARRGVVTLITLTQHGILGAEMATPIDLSFLSDNVFLLRFFETGGEIRQALSMVKRRTGRHERTIRELRFGEGGIRLSKPLVGFSGVLGGSPVYAPPAGNGR